MTLLRVPQPYDFEVSTGRFRAFGPDLANLYEEAALYRVVGQRQVAIRAAPGGVDVDPLDSETEPVVRKLLGLEFDLSAFRGWAEQHSRLASLERALRGFRPPLAPDPFESLVTSITAQQVSLQAAFAIRNRFIALLGVRAGRAYAFPTREAAARSSPEALTAIGFSRRKAEYVVELARSDLDLGALAALPDEEVKLRLRAVRGLGEWTADWFVARHLARPHAWPAGDLGLRKAVSRFYGRPEMLSTAEVRAVAPEFAPFENLSAHYLLTGLLRGTLGSLAAAPKRGVTDSVVVAP